MTTLAANDNSPRSIEFDRMLMKYEPAIRSLSRKIAKHEDAAEELFQSSVVIMLRRHRECRTETFWTWAALCVRDAAHEFMRINSTKSRSADVISISAFEKIPGSVEASQENETDLALVLSLLAGRGGKMVVRVAMGETLEAIGKDFGMCKERVRQIVSKERTRVQTLLREVAA